MDDHAAICRHVEFSNDYNKKYKNHPLMTDFASDSRSKNHINKALRIKNFHRYHDGLYGIVASSLAIQWQQFFNCIRFQDLVKSFHFSKFLKLLMLLILTSKNISKIFNFKKKKKSFSKFLKVLTLLILTSKQISNITISSPNLEATPHLPVLPAAPHEQMLSEDRLHRLRLR